MFATALEPIELMTPHPICCTARIMCPSIKVGIITPPRPRHLISGMASTMRAHAADVATPHPPPHVLRSIKWVGKYSEAMTLHPSSHPVCCAAWIACGSVTDVIVTPYPALLPYTPLFFATMMVANHPSQFWSYLFAKTFCGDAPVKSSGASGFFGMSFCNMLQVMFEVVSKLFFQHPRYFL